MDTQAWSLAANADFRGERKSVGMLPGVSVVTTGTAPLAASQRRSYRRFEQADLFVVHREAYAQTAARTDRPKGETGQISASP